MEIVVVYVEHGGGLDPEERGGDVELTRGLGCPWEEESVDQAGDGAALGGGGEDGLFEALVAFGSYLGHVLLGVVAELESVVVAVGEGGEGEALR